MIQVLQSKSADLYLIESAAEVIAAEARFNIWVLDRMKESGVIDERWMELLDALENVLHPCEAAVDAFFDSCADENVANVPAANESLRAALLGARQGLDSLRD
jgi:hypothetical protein